MFVSIKLNYDCNTIDYEIRPTKPNSMQHKFDAFICLKRWEEFIDKEFF